MMVSVASKCGAGRTNGSYNMQTRDVEGGRRVKTSLEKMTPRRLACTTGNLLPT
jgi:hypothetical protein